MYVVGMWMVYAGVAFVAVMWMALWARALLEARLTLDTAADSISFADTVDGVRLAIYRYVPKTPRPNECPVILCHGFGANRFNLDFDDKLSLARYLRQRGYDVFVLELRGAGMSKAPKAASFDDFVNVDLPAAIAHVRQITGAEKVNWVGHSMGGIVMYAALGGPLRRHVNAVATLGAPASFEHQRFLRIVSWLYPLARPFLGRAGTTLARFGAGFVGSWTPGFSALANLRNIESRVIRRAMWSVMSETSVLMIDTFVSWLRSGTGPTLGHMTTAEHWSKVRLPLLLIAGQADWCLAPPASVRHAFYHAASVKKELVILAKRSGYRADYGHGDLAIGRHTPDEVFPLIERFLWEHRRAAEPGSESQQVA